MPQRARTSAVHDLSATPTASPPPTPSAAAAANDNGFILPNGKHSWPCMDRLRSGRLMRSADANAAAMRALGRLRDDLRGGHQTEWAMLTSAVDDGAVVGDEVAGQGPN